MKNQFYKKECTKFSNDLAIVKKQAFINITMNKFLTLIIN